MKTIPDHLTPEQAWERLSACLRLPVEQKLLSEALDHCLAEDFFALEDVPIANRSFMDGYAVRAQDTSRVPARLRVVCEVSMGQIPAQKIGSGEAASIPTGGFLPLGADAVVMQEDTSESEDHVLIRRSVRSGENVQVRGEDFRKGDVLFSAPHRLRPQDLSTIATFGVTRVNVYRKAALCVLSTGNELISYETHQQEAGTIRETNSLALASAASEFKFPCRPLGIIPDEFPAQRAAVAQALSMADVVLISGGSSVGVKDYTLEVIRSFPDHRVHFHGLAIRPGNPTIFAGIGSKWIFGLPGQPVSSLIVFYQFVLPFLFHLSGRPVDYSFFPFCAFRTQTARLSTTIKPLKTKTDYVRLRLVRSGDEFTAVPVPGKSASLSTLALADGFSIVPPGEESIQQGTSLTVILFP